MSNNQRDVRPRDVRETPHSHSNSFVLTNNGCLAKELIPASGLQVAIHRLSNPDSPRSVPILHFLLVHL
ncbi:hypothetical protein HOLleu_18647 [Holothuria leucospilota]|uniref:Uncharacterized protein n=1 Tax=Holothuria leucospilota TaxID=206669 RepID=A0A9Q1H9A3_HOLLE|nr:hypothetical protein HOLleu_18647 [Holothuria leucospilota]